MNNIQNKELHRILGREVGRKITPEEANSVSGGLMMQTCTVVGHSDGSTTHDSSNND